MEIQIFNPNNKEKTNLKFRELSSLQKRVKQTVYWHFNGAFYYDNMEPKVLTFTGKELRICKS